tara:strand:+ start:172694 stop:173173 length:480 start_codon:yes stop_codon:yes gene_type:complete
MSMNLEILANLVWELRFLSMVSQTAHWRVFGPSAPGDHGLYKVVYEKLDELLDPLAEVLTAHLEFNDRVVCPLAQATYVRERMDSIMPHLEGTLQNPDALAVLVFEEVKSLVHHFREIAAEIGGSTGLTFGLEDRLASTASELESLMYFLERRAQLLTH